MRRTLTGAVGWVPGRHGLHRAAWGPMIHLDLLGHILPKPAQSPPSTPSYSAKRIFVCYITGGACSGVGEGGNRPVVLKRGR